MEDLQARKEKLNSSISSITNRINAFMDTAYRKFHTKYLLVMEGSQAEARKKLINMTRIFLRYKRRNLLTLAFGLLKVPMVEAALNSRTPQYQKVAACNLLLGWLKRARRKNFQRWLTRWVYITSCLVFVERMKAAAKIQTLVRRSRDRKKFCNMHRSKPYLGPLSDIQLGPYRPNIRYKIPRQIRTERRMYWLAATLIQTCFRCWFESKDYFLKKRRIVLLQSICRMWPKYRHYQRLKRATIGCQARARRTLWRNHYLRLKFATLIAQKYVRRFLAILWKLNFLSVIWEEIEEEKFAVIKIQRRIRIHRAKRKRKGKRMYKRMLQWGALVIQRNWYRKKRAFHTFFLMCALREREAQDIALEKLATKMGRHQCARRIQRLYRQRFWARVVTNVIRVQCWYRGRLGFRNAEKLRKQRWASRKLYYWTKGLLKRIHVMARRIQSWWWKQRKRRLLKHLWARQRIRDRDNKFARSERRHHAALRIQAIVKGVWDRRWVRRTRAALLIQKNWRFLHGLKKWKRMKKDHIMRGVQRAVTTFIDKAVKLRVAALMKYHTSLVVKLQALARGFIIRRVFARTFIYAKKLAPAVIRIQRFWRKSGILTQAVEEVLARRRMEANPFKFCHCLHEIMLTVRRELKVLYSLRDPRIGMRVSDFLYRLGYYEYLELFPKRDFKYVTELQTLTMEKLTELYTMAQNRNRANAKDNSTSRRNKNNSNEEDTNTNKKRKIPVQDLQTILNAVTIPLYPKKKRDISILQTILSFPEYASPQEAIESIRSYFLKKFGRHLLSRATNVATELVENAFYEYNTFRSFAQPVTKAQIMRALTEAPESAAVLATLDQIRQVGSSAGSNVSQFDEWLKCDVERMKQSFGILQMAFDRVFDVLPRGSIIVNFEKTVGKGAAFKRKADYLKKKFLQVQRMQKAIAAKQQARGIRAQNVLTDVSASKTEEAGGDKANASEGSKKTLPADLLARHLTPADCVELPYHGTDKYLDLEYFSSSSRLYLEIVEKYFSFSLSIQSIKNSWHNKAMRRAVQSERRKIFLKDITTSYLSEQTTNKVLQVWEKLRNREVAQKKYNNVIMAARARKFQVEALLAYIPRYRIQTYYDDPSGYEYYVDEHGVASYELPVYSFAQYLAAMKIQNEARKHIQRSLMRLMQKEEEERRQIQEMEQVMLREQKEALKACVFEIRSIFDQRELNSSATNSSVTQLLSFVRPVADGKKKNGKKESKIINKKPATKKSMDEELEEQLPWKYRFDSVVNLVSGMWALYFPPSPGTTSKKGSIHTAENYLFQQLQAQQSLVYEIIVVFHIRKEENLCDVRNFKGVITKDVPIKRLRHLPYHVGFPVECRYKYRKLFYRAKIHYINAIAGLDPVYDVTYEDGEKEYNLGRDAIRPNASYLTEWFAERFKILKQLFLVSRRHNHFAGLRKERMIAFGDRTRLFIERKQNGNYAHRPIFDGKGKPLSKDHGGNHANSEEFANEEKEQQNDGVDNEDSLTVNSQDDGISVLSVENEGEAEDMSTVAPAYQSPPAGTKRNNNQASNHEDKSESAHETKENGVLSSKQANLMLSFYAEHQASRPAGDSNDQQSSMLAVLDPLGPAMIKVKLKVTRRALHMGWQIISSPNSAEPVYYHAQRDEQRNHTEAPFFSATEIHMVHRIQSRWILHKAIVRVKKYLALFKVPDYVQSILQKGSKMAFIGYKQEGLSCLQFLTRAGYFEIADTIRDYYRDLRKSIWQLSIEELATKKPEEFDRLGILQSTHIRDLKEFQSWWKKTLPYEKENKMALINYYSSPEDPRSIEQCIQDSLPLLQKKFFKAIKSSQAKTKRALDMLIEETKFPLTHAQIDVYLKKYADHPDQARVILLNLCSNLFGPLYIFLYTYFCVL